jgi:hypothetical protein
MPAPAAEAAAAAPAASLHDRLWAVQPSVTSDGSQILVPYTAEDGGRGMPNLRFQVWNRRGKLVQQQLIQDVEQYLGDGGPPEAASQVTAQERAAGKLLDDLERKGLQPLVSAPSSRDDSSRGRVDYTYVAEGDHTPSLTLDLSEAGTLTIKPRGHAAIRRDGGWRTAPTPKEARRLQARYDAGEIGCFNPAHIGATWVDLARRVAVISIGFDGNDTCWEPSSDMITVAW